MSRINNTSQDVFRYEKKCTEMYLFLFRHPFVIACLWGILLGGAGYFAFSLRLDAGSSIFFPDSSPEVVSMSKDMDMPPFSRLLFIDLAWEAAVTEENIPEQLAAAADTLIERLPKDLAVLGGQAPSRLEPDTFLRLLPSTAVWSEQHLNRLLNMETSRQVLREAKESLGGLWSITEWIQSDPFSLRTLLSRAMPTQGALPIPDPVLGYPFDGTRTHLLLTLKPLHEMHDVERAGALLDTLKKIIATLPKDIRATIVGGHRHTAENSQTIFRDIERIVSLSILGFAVTYLFLVRSLGAIWLLAVPAAAALFGMAGMSLVWPTVSGLALGFGASVLGLAEDYAVHVHFALRSATKTEQPQMTLTRLTQPLSQALLMNCVGFSVLLFSCIPAVRQLASFAMVTLIGGYLISLWLLPLCPWRGSPLIEPKQIRFSGQRLRPSLYRILPAILVLTGICGLALYKVDIDASPQTLGANIAELKADASRLQKIWGDTMQSTAFVVHGRTLSEALQQADALTERLRKEQDGSILTITDLLPPKEKAKERILRWNTWIQTSGKHLQASLVPLLHEQGFSQTAFAPFWSWFAAPQTVNTLEMLQKAGLGDLVDTFVRITATETRVLVLAQTPFAAYLAHNGLSEKTGTSTFTNVVVLSPERLEWTLQQALKQEQNLLPVVIGLCLLMLCFLLRRIEQFFLVVLPPLAALAAVLFWMFLTNKPLTLVSIAVLPVMLSLAIDHGLIMTHDLTHGTALGAERAMTVSSLTSLTGMGMLALADHPALRDMGYVILIGLLVEWITARWVLPVMCTRVKI